VPHLQALRLKPGTPGEGYPFALPFVQGLGDLTFRSPVTCLVGENGTGKSTLLEAIAAAAGLPTVGGVDVERDGTLAPARRLAAHLTLSWRRRTRRGLYMRAEDFFNFASRMNLLAAELDDIIESYKGELTGYALRLAQGSARAQRAALTQKYGDLHALSHGESFLRVFQQRFVPGGLYLLDEPDAALSPQRQLAFLALLKDLAQREAQFIVATHSPILMAYPDAALLAFDGRTITEVPYDALEHVALLRGFLANPQAYVRRR
jgi:predicted ATPase